ncbi:uncharacterized protein LOC143552305 [Bidens hawaiensis]|uniref:uncharacterized protein LOC143552305 n=1 Tax=Bidens hawaiensis TaxID=980011 RepID=UPI00404ADC38
MTLIQQGVHDSLFSRIAAADTAKETWDILRVEFQGDSQVQSVKLQGLRRAFENMAMKDDEAVGDYFSRIMNNAGQQRSYGEELGDQKVVEKVLRSLSHKFDYVIPSIEVVFDLSNVSPVKLMGLLQSQEERMNSRASLDKETKNGHADEHALQVYQEQNYSSRGRGRGGRSFPRGRGNGRGRGTFDKSKVPQCFTCKKYGHFRKDCWYNDEVQANVAENEENDGEINKKENERSFVSLDETFKLDVRLGDKKRLAVEGRGIVKIQTGGKTFKLLDHVYYAPKLEYNLLSVGQLMKKGYSIHFNKGKCVIKDGDTERELMEVAMARNNMFVLDAASLMAAHDAPTNKQQAEALKWHSR